MLEVLIRPAEFLKKRVPVTRRRRLYRIVAEIRGTTLPTRDSEPCSIARIEFKKQKKLYGYRVAGQGICTLYDDDDGMNQVPQ